MDSEKFPPLDAYTPLVQEKTLDEVLKYPIEFQLDAYAPEWLDPNLARRANEQALAEHGNASLWKQYFSELATLKEEHVQEQILKTKAQIIQDPAVPMDGLYTHLASKLSVEDIALAQSPELALQHLQATLANRALTLLANANRLTINGVPDAATLSQEALALKITTELNALTSPKSQQSNKLRQTVKDINPQFFRAKLL